MHEIFINYRTKGGKELAYLCDQKLSARFGSDSVFHASRSIDVGSDYTDVLLQEVRRSRVLLVLIDENWLDAPDRRRPGRRALLNPQDWVRREIEEALRSGVLIVPLFISRKVEQLDPHRLPRSIEQLASCQYARVALRTLEPDLAALGDRLARQVPGLAALDTSRAHDEPRPEPLDSPALTPVRTEGQSGGIGNVGGSLGTFVNTAHGPLHTGSGDMINSRNINRDGTTYIAGGNQGGVQHRFEAGPSAPRVGEAEDEDR